jgi:microcystin-dependent protein
MRTRMSAVAIVGVVALGGSLFGAPRASAQASDPFIGQLMLVGFNFCPVGWAPAQGQLLSIAQNTALFSLLGTYYGGDGQTSFALPDLRGRVPIGVGQGPGLSPRQLGEAGGEEQVALTVQQMPSHVHALFGSSQNANAVSPSGALPAAKLRTTLYQSGGDPDVQLHPGAIGAKGGGQPHENMQPYLALTWCIALQGVYPSRP